MTTDATGELTGTERARLELCAMAAEISTMTGKQPAMAQPGWVTLRGAGRQVTWVWMTPGNHGMHLIDKGGKLALGAWNHDTGERADVKFSVKFSPAASGIPAAFLASALSVILDQAVLPLPKDRWEGHPHPVTMTHAQLCGILEDVSRRVQSGDSLEGSVSWAIPEDEAAPAGSFDVLASYRVGNREGQGGMRMIRREDPPPASQEEVTDGAQ